jgi:alkanesulfonate monooxygenase SsuD/methylene tetrahydromethanopterin reductase-like flavin-dependent oxidoreductase (luciferase family)
MEFNLFLPQMRLPFEQLVARARAAEAAGFVGMTGMDHLTPPLAAEQPMFDAIVTTTWLAAHTERLTLGSLVLCDAFRLPAVLARQVVSIDHASGGRYELGIGWGSVPEELEAYGIGTGPPRVRAARLAESLVVLDLMFAGERFDFAGEHFALRGAVGRPVPAQSPRPPVHIGGAGPRLTMPIVREHADWWNCPTYAIDRLAELAPLAGPARISTQHPVALARTESERDDVVATGTRRFGSWGGLVGGTAREVADALAAETAVGVEGFVIQFSDFGTPRTVEHFMGAVAPHVR